MQSDKLLRDGLQPLSSWRRHLELLINSWTFLPDLSVFCFVTTKTLMEAFYKSVFYFQIQASFDFGERKL